MNVEKILNEIHDEEHLVYLSVAAGIEMPNVNYTADELKKLNKNKLNIQFHKELVNNLISPKHINNLLKYKKIEIVPYSIQRFFPISPIAYGAYILENEAKLERLSNMDFLYTYIEHLDYVFFDDENIDNNMPIYREKSKIVSDVEKQQIKEYWEAVRDFHEYFHFHRNCIYDYDNKEELKLNI